MRVSKLYFRIQRNTIMVDRRRRRPKRWDREEHMDLAEKERRTRAAATAVAMAA
jgi:hypothetical protein